MSNAFDHENTIYGTFGEFEPTPADVDWSEHDALADAYFAELDAQRERDYADYIAEQNADYWS